MIPVAPPASDGAALLDDIRQFIARFVAYPSEASLRAVTLWVVHTHAFEYASATPYLNVYSPAPRCGKSTLFEVLSLLVRDPIGGSNMSSAVMYRIIEQAQPTLLLDEMDARADRERASAIQSILNSGYKRGSTALVWRCEAPSFNPVAFNVFCPKAFAGIGQANLHPTTLDRSIPILLERKLATDTVERYRARQIEPEADELRDRIAEWVSINAELLGTARPSLPDEIDDRAQEIWEPLLAIADAAGGSWPHTARATAIELHSEPDLEDLPLSILLLNDIRTIFDQQETWTLSSETIVHHLGTFGESPWRSWTTHGVKTGLSPRALARMLRPFSIRPRTVRLGGEDKPTKKGYQRDWFHGAWERYLPDHAGEDASGE